MVTSWTKITINITWPPKQPQVIELGAEGDIQFGRGGLWEMRTKCGHQVMADADGDDDDDDEDDDDDSDDDDEVNDSGSRRPSTSIRSQILLYGDLDDLVLRAFSGEW